MARTAEITFKEFRRRYSSEDACRAELFRLRFPNGFVCPKCGCVEYYPIHGRNTFQCHSCRNGHAPHSSAPDPLVLGNLSVRNR